MKEILDNNGFPALKSKAGRTYPLPTGDSEKDKGRINFSLFGYASNHVHTALLQDDADAFVHFLRECGGPNISVLGYTSVAAYVAHCGGKHCQEAFKDLVA